MRSLTRDSALGHLRVLELCSMAAGPYCGKLLADLGAEVIKGEPPRTGDAARWRSPLAGDRVDPELSLLFLYLNTNKKSVTLDLSTKDGQRMLERLVKTVDVLIEDFSPSQAERLGLDFRRFQRLNPGLVMTSITPFGRTGPYRDYRAYPLNTYLAGGEGYLNPVGVQYLDRPPVQLGKYLGEYLGGLNAAVATLAAVYFRELTGRGQHIDTSKQESLLVLASIDLNRYPNHNLVSSRATQVTQYGGPMPCRDGYVAVTFYEEREWRGLIEVMEHPTWAGEERFKDWPSRAAHGAELNALIAAWTKERTKAEVADKALAAGCPIAPYNMTNEVYACKQLIARGFFVNIEHPVAGKFAYPSAPYHFSRTPWKVRCPAPLLGQHNDVVRQEVLGHTTAGSATLAKLVGEAVGNRALDGIRVLDFCQGIAGPLTCTLLAYLGAEVIKVESRPYLDITRQVPHPITKRPPDPDESPAFFDINHNKLGVVLNLQHAQAIDVIKRLVQVSDVVVENFRPGVLKHLGFEYQVLSRWNPTVVMLSSSTMGQKGPEAKAVGYAPLFAAVSGLGELTGYPDSPPPEIRYSVDAACAVTNAYAVLAALNYRQRTGLGQYIDVSSTEALAVLVGDSLLDYAATGRIQRRRANRDDSLAPHNAYRCQGNDRWISIVVGTDEEWGSLCTAMQNPEWTKDERFASASGRWKHQEEMDRLIEAWTVQLDAYELMGRLQRVGVAAVPVFTSEDLFTDPHLAERDFARVIEQPRVGAQVVIGPPWKLSVTPADIRRHAPLLGEHNGHVFTEMLGFSDDEVKQMLQAGVLR